jgi:hypothetical protein
MGMLNVPKDANSRGRSQSALFGISRVTDGEVRGAHRAVFHPKRKFNTSTTYHNVRRYSQAAPELSYDMVRLFVVLGRHNESFIVPHRKRVWTFTDCRNPLIRASAPSTLRYMKKLIRAT